MTVLSCIAVVLFGCRYESTFLSNAPTAFQRRCDFHLCSDNKQEAKGIRRRLHRMIPHSRHAAYTARIAAELSRMTDRLTDRIASISCIGCIVITVIRRRVEGWVSVVSDDADGLTVQIASLQWRRGCTRLSEWLWLYCVATFTVPKFSSLLSLCSSCMPPMVRHRNSFALSFASALCRRRAPVCY